MAEITQSAALTSPHAKQVLDISGINLVHLCRINREHRGCQSDRHTLAIILQFLLRCWLGGEVGERQHE